jgi:pimeloyl-ACP methyl ester carboxylesterase
MNNLRKYGNPPFKAAVIHGGPGAPGEMAPVARELSKICGILEPLQTKATLEGQVQELKSVIKANTKEPVILIGHSWGAMLSFIVTARYPSIVKKLILIGSGPFDHKYAPAIMQNRLNRLDEKERLELESLIKTLETPSSEKSGAMMTRLGALVSKTDSYNPMPHVSEVLECQPEIFQGVWSEAAALRKRGGFLDLAESIICPVVAFHGNYDPTPSEGVKNPLAGILVDYRHILLTECGHNPWLENEAIDNFYALLKKELSV